MTTKTVFAISLLLLLALTLAVAEDAPAPASASAPAPEVGATVETADAEADGSATEEEDDEEEEADGDEEDSDDDEYDDSGSTDEDIESWFNDIDTNKDQHVDFDEYKTYFLNEKIDGISPNITDADLQDSFKTLNKDGSGKVTMAQWKEFYIQHEQDPEFVDGHHGPLTAEQKAEYKKHFDDADKDKDTFLNLQEFQALTAETDADASEEEHIKALFAEVDTNKDGKISFDEYLGENDTAAAGAADAKPAA